MTLVIHVVANSRGGVKPRRRARGPRRVMGGGLARIGWA